VAQALPLVLSIMRLYRAKTVRIPQVATALRLIENFTFQFNAVTQSRGGGGISAMYAKLAQSIAGVSNGDQFGQKLKDLKKKFEERLPPPEEFDYPFASLVYRDNHTRERELVRYVLIKTSAELGMGEEYAKEKMTIEHIQSQSQGVETLEPEDVGAIGNLALVTEKVNHELDDKPFKQKKPILQKVPWLSAALRGVDEWAEEQIIDRGHALAELARDKVWKL
jgi:hypothetical protein